MMILMIMVIMMIMMQAARTIEDIPVAVFPAWRAPLKVHLAIFIFLYALSFAKFQVDFMIQITWNTGMTWRILIKLMKT